MENRVSYIQWKGTDSKLNKWHVLEGNECSRDSGFLVNVNITASTLKKKVLIYSVNQLLWGKFPYSGQI